jgi:lysophospholipase L1-like esterase
MKRILALSLLLPCLLSAATNTPAPRFEADIQAFLAADRAKPPTPGGILFVGSSIFRLWTNVVEAMAPLPVVNRAFGGSRTGDQLDRFDQVVKPWAPRILVYYCGSNDLKAGNDPAAIFARFRSFSERVQRELPGTKLVFVSSTRSPDRVDKWDRVDRYNGLVRDYCAATPGHTFIDVNPALFDAEGRPRRELYVEDQLHLRPAAYVEFARRIRPVLEKLVSERVSE